MMKRTLSAILFICSVGFASTALAQDTDSDPITSVSTTGWIEWTVEPRDDNALGLHPIGEEDDLWLFSKQDCIEQIQTDISFTLSQSPAGSDRVLRLFRGDDCDTTDGFDDCTEFQNATPTSTLVTITNIDLNEMIDGLDCNGTSDASEQIWVAFSKSPVSLDTEDGDQIQKLAKVVVDFTGPSTTTTIKNVLIGDDSLEVSFARVTATDVAGYALFFAPAGDEACTSGPLTANEVPTSDSGVFAKTSDSSDANTITVNSLDNGVSYQVAIATLDNYGNPSALSDPQCATPQESIGIGKVKTDGEYCFIATAAFGNYDHPTVKTLRTFRDRFLRQIPAGDAMIAAYYSVGPSLATMIKGDAATKEMVRNALGLFAQVTRFLVVAGPILVVLAVFAAMLLGLFLGFAAPRAKEK